MHDLALNLVAKEILIKPGPNAHERLQEAMILMNEGDTLIIDSGYYSSEDGLSLDVDRVTVIGRGMEETILDFKNQQSGAQGFLSNFEWSNAKRLCNFRCQGRCLKSYWG